MPEVYYLFCLIAADRLPPLEGQGIDGEQPLFIERGPYVAAVLCGVPLEMFSGPDAEERLKDLAWIGPRACRHEEVILAARRHVPVLPVRFGTVFSTLELLAAALERHRERIAAFMQQVTGSDEWTVKGLLDRRKAREDIMNEKLNEQAAALADLSPGKRYFMEQRIKSEADKDLRVRLRALTKDVVKSLSPLTLDSAQRRLLSCDVTGGEEEMFFNGALLVPATTVEGLRSLISELNYRFDPRGMRF
ncbi:MAG TPA: GvpL/GvpF family gas vesicle protein, partial [Geobacteraceae bacterium]|nr:GvpL/GvpF family gas vesicle protein [Geobacteraceae bacterium]